MARTRKYKDGRPLTIYIEGEVIDWLKGIVPGGKMSSYIRSLIMKDFDQNGQNIGEEKRIKNKLRLLLIQKSEVERDMDDLGTEAELLSSKIQKYKKELADLGIETHVTKLKPKEEQGYQLNEHEAAILGSVENEKQTE